MNSPLLSEKEKKARQNQPISLAMVLRAKDELDHQHLDDDFFKLDIVKQANKKQAELVSKIEKEKWKKDTLEFSNQSWTGLFIVKTHKIFKKVLTRVEKKKSFHALKIGRTKSSEERHQFYSKRTIPCAPKKPFQ